MATNSKPRRRRSPSFSSSSSYLRSPASSASSSPSRSLSRSPPHPSSTAPARKGRTRSPSPLPSPPQPPPPRKSSPGPDSTVLHVDHLSRNVNEDHLKEFFENYGEVVNVELSMDRVVNLPRGHGYVEFKNRADAEKALLYLNGHLLKESQLHLQEGDLLQVEELNHLGAGLILLQFVGERTSLQSGVEVHPLAGDQDPQLEDVRPLHPLED